MPTNGLYHEIIWQYTLDYHALIGPFHNRKILFFFSLTYSNSLQSFPEIEKFKFRLGSVISG